MLIILFFLFILLLRNIAILGIFIAEVYPYFQYLKGRDSVISNILSCLPCNNSFVEEISLDSIQDIDSFSYHFYFPNSIFPFELWTRYQPFKLTFAAAYYLCVSRGYSLHFSVPPEEFLWHCVEQSLSYRFTFPSSTLTTAC